MAYDPQGPYILLFGGENVNGALQNSTWLFSGGNWSDLTPDLGVVPPARWGAAMAWDASDQQMVLFGGCENSACTLSFADTWAFSNGSWRDLTPGLSVSPDAREEAAMTYDAFDGYVLLVGGRAAQTSPTVYSDVWAFQHGAWTEMTPMGTPGTPNARYGAQLVYDPTLSAAVLFAGAATTGSLLQDTWTYQADHWTNESGLSAATPGARVYASMTYDAVDGYLLLYGGAGNTAIYADTWSYGAGGWTELSPTGDAPPARYAAAMSYDASDQVVMLFSGNAGSSSFWTGTSIYSSGTWTLLINPSGSNSAAPVGLSPTGLLLVVDLGFVLAIILTGVGYASQARRWAKGGRAFVVAPNQSIQWSDERPSIVPLWVIALLPTILVVALGLIVAFAGGVPTVPALTLTGIVSVPIALVLGGVLFLFSTRGRIRRIGATEGGVILRRASSETRIAWTDIQPPLDPPRRAKMPLYFRYRDPANPNFPSGFALSREQARMIIQYPLAPQWPLSEPLARFLGITYVARSPIPSTPLSSAEISPGAGVPPPPARPPPPTYSRVVSPAVPPPPPPPAPLPTDRCPNCGRTFPVGRYIFCPGCGQRMR